MIDAYDILNASVADAMQELHPEQSPEHRLGMAIHLAFAALDEIMAMGADEETRVLVLKERIAMAQLLSRAQLINSFILVSGKPGQLKVITNG